MAKRGETRPWRVAYEWIGAGIKGVNTYRTEQQANDEADKMSAYAVRMGGDLTVTVVHR